MGSLKYVFSRIKKMNKRGMLDKVAFLKEKTGRTKASLFLDMVWCGFRFGAGYLDYDLFEMYNMNAKQRNTVLTRGRNDVVVKKHNNKDFYHVFRYKDEFNLRFAEFIRRDWIRADEHNRDEVKAFFRRHDTVMLKPVDGGCGKGIEKITVAERDADELYEYALKTNKYVIEEVIKQHADVNKIYPSSINTVRVVTLLNKEDKVAIPFVYWRIGAGGRFVDNFNSEGMVAPVDEKIGVVADRAIDKKKNLYAVHPDTGAQIKGFKFPFWEDILALCRAAAHIVPEVGYVGWDVAMTPDGPLLVEANQYPGHDIYQLPEHTPDKIGVYPKLKNAVYI